MVPDQGGEVDKTQLEFMHAGFGPMEFYDSFVCGQGSRTQRLSGISMGAEEKG